MAQAKPTNKTTLSGNYNKSQGQRTADLKRRQIASLEFLISLISVTQSVQHKNKINP